MNTQQIGNRMLRALTAYQRMLSVINEEAFYLPPKESPWSCSQLYSHIIRANLRSLLAIQKCVYNKSAGRGRTTLLGWMILASGKLPAQKGSAPIKKISRDNAQNELLQLKNRIKELLPRIAACSSGCRVRHSHLGMLNARQWLRFMQIHTCHHLKQLQVMHKSIRT